MRKIGFGEFNFKNGILPLGVITVFSILGIGLTGQSFNESIGWFVVLFFLFIVMTIFNYKVWKKRK